MRFILWFLSGCPLLSLAQVAVSSEAANVLYVGFDNPLTVAVSDVPDSNLALVPSVGNIVRTDQAGRYQWRITKFTTPKATLVLHDTVRGAVLDTFFYRVKTFPDPTLYVHANSRASLLATSGLGAYLNFGACGTVALESYDIEIRKKGNHYGRRLHNQGSRFNAHVLGAFEELRPGDTVIFQNATCRMPGDTVPRRLSQVIELVMR
jgi:hypothetical protein